LADDKRRDRRRGCPLFYAAICAQVGERDLAIEQFKTLAKIPAGPLTVGELRLEFKTAEPWLCTDNAAMIAFAAVLKLDSGASSNVTEEIDPNLALR